MSSTGTQRLAAMLGAAAALAVPCVALAAPDDQEPNDSQVKATKLQPGKTYDATIDKLDDAVTQTKGDVDWYSLNAAKGTVDISYTALQDQGSCFGPEARLMDTAGKTLGTAQPAKGHTEQIRYNAPADGLLYLRVQQYQIDSCDAPNPYRFTPDFTAASGGGGGGGSIDGLTIKAKDTQKQRGKKIQVKFKAGASEAIDIAAEGTVKAGGKKLKLSKDAATADAGNSAKLVLSAKGRAGKKIAAAIADGDKVKAKISVAVADSDGNDATQRLTITLR